MEKIAVFPGSFDPFTIGHESIVNRANSIFDKIIIMIGFNANKKSFFSIENEFNGMKNNNIINNFSKLDIFHLLLSTISLQLYYNLHKETFISNCFSLFLLQL